MTAFSIAIGIAAVVWVVAIGKAGQRRAEAQLAALGRGLVWISAGSRNFSGARTGSHAAGTLTAEDAGAILAEVPRIQSVALQSDTSVTVVSPNGNRTTRARGISVSFLDTWWWTIVEGAAFTERDVDEAQPVVLLGRTVRCSSRWRSRWPWASSSDSARHGRPRASTSSPPCGRNERGRRHRTGGLSAPVSCCRRWGCNRVAGRGDRSRRAPQSDARSQAHGRTVARS